MDGIVLANTMLTAIVIPWLIVIERRLSRIEGYLRICNGEYGDEEL